MIQEDFKSINYNKQVEFKLNTEVSYLLRRQWKVTNDNFEVCRGSNKQNETPITQTKFLSAVSSVFDQFRLIATFMFTWKNFWDTEVETVAVAEIFKWNKQLAIVPKTGIEGNFFKTVKDRIELHLFCDASEDTMSAIEKLRKILIPCWELQAAALAVRLKKQIVHD